MPIILFVLIASLFHTVQADARIPSVAVSVAPYLEIVQEIAGPDIQVHLVVPQGASSHTFETTPKQLIALREDSLWFTIGEPFEQKAIQSLQSMRAPEIIDLRQGLSLIEESCGCHHHHASDPHIWMDPEMMRIQVGHIAKALIRHFPQDEASINNRTAAIFDKLSNLKNTIDKCLLRQSGTLIVSHPSYGYLLKPYPGIDQYALEFEGKEPSAKQLSESVSIITHAHAQTIFTQMQYSMRAAARVAEVCKMKIVDLNPYSSAYFESMSKIAEEFSQELHIQNINREKN